MTYGSHRSWVFSLLASLLALVSCAVPQRAESQALRAQSTSYELEVLIDGAPARTFVHAGETHILGEQGSRYTLRVHNRSARRIEAVVSVDGLDVIDGKPGDFANKRGYLVSAYSYVDIEGWRLSDREAAAFRFAPIGESYAAKTGRARDVGVIGVAVFPERIVRAPRPVYSPYRPSYPESEQYGSMRERSYDEAPRAEAKSARGESVPSAAAPAPSMGSAAASGRAADAAKKADSVSPERRSRSGLGTEFGEAMSSHIEHVAFVRAQPSRPASLLGARYNDRAGLYALGIDVDARDPPSDLALRQSADPFPAQRYARPPADWRRD
jgi:hypothetical protein